MGTTIAELEDLFDEHPSLDASLQDFEPTSSEIGQSPRFGYPSHHSGFRSETESEMGESDSGGRYSRLKDVLCGLFVGCFASESIGPDIWVF